MTRKSIYLIAGLLSSFLMISPAHAAMGDVILSFNAKADNSTGLTWADGYLWNIGHGHNAPADLLKLDPSNGNIISSIKLPIEHVMGLTWDGYTFWAVSHQNSVIYRLNATDGSIMHSFPSPNPNTVETGCKGLAWDGQYLWYADNDFDMIYQLDPVNGAIITSYPSPGSNPQGLTWDGTFLWHFDRGAGMVYQLYPSNGSARITFPAPGNGEGDLAWDGTYLWMSRNADDRIYKIEVVNEPPVADAGPDQTVYEGDTVQFDGSNSYDPNGTIISHNWDFDDNVDSDGDGNYTNDIDSTGPLPTHIYGDDGIYNVTLTVFDNYNYNDTDFCVLYVNNRAPAIVPFGPFIMDIGLSLNINGDVTDPGSDDLTFTWGWGDGTSDAINTHYNDGMGSDPYPSPWRTFPFNVIDAVQHSYVTDGIYTLNLTVSDDDGGVNMYSTTVTVIGIDIPTLFINVSSDGKDVILNWNAPQVTGIDHYLIYRSTSQTDFDFNNVWVNTSSDMEVGESAPIPLRTTWNDTNAADPGNITNYQEQYYYIIRAVHVLGEASRTSRTVGKWTRTFPQGVSTFSLPLEPIENLTADSQLNDMNAEYIKWMDPGTNIWMKHGEGVFNYTQLNLGEGYEVKFLNPINYTFTGFPGAMISYDDDTGFLGFDPANEAKNLTVTVQTGGDVFIAWEPPNCMGTGDWYEIYYSHTRDGFFKTLGTDHYQACAPLVYGNIATTISGLGANAPGERLYFMIVPFNSLGVRGASTYSIGIWTEEILAQYDTFGIPLKLDSSHTADWYCDNIPNTVGINYFAKSQKRWSWHSTLMPQGAFDPNLVMGEGYQISTSSLTKFIFVGR